MDAEGGDEVEGVSGSEKEKLCWVCQEKASLQCSQSGAMKTRPSALGMSDPVLEFLKILETQVFPSILKTLKGTKRTKGAQKTKWQTLIRGRRERRGRREQRERRERRGQRVLLRS